MTPQLPDAHNSVTGIRKAAILLMGIGEPLSADLIRQLDHDEMRRIGTEIASMQSVAPEQMIRVFREFETLTASGRFFARGGPERARSLIESAVGADQAGKILDRSNLAAGSKIPDTSEGPFAGVEPGELAAALREENPQTIALVLSNLPAVQAGPLLASLDPNKQRQVALRIALMDRISQDVFNQIAEVVRGKLKASRQLQRSDGTRALASILNNMEGGKAEVVLSALETENHPAATSVRQLMFVFEDIIHLEKESVRTLIGRLDRKILTVALKGTSEKLKGHFTQCMSQRSTEMLNEDMEALGPVRIRDVSGAQSQIITAIRQMEKEGIIASGSAGGDEYVV